MYDLTDEMKRYITPQSRARAAEMLALPQFVCRRRDCRRKQKCAWYFKKSGEPCCLANLDAGQRQAFDDMAGRVAKAWWSMHLFFRDPMTSYFREERVLEDAAVEAIRPLVRPADMPAYRYLQRRRAKEPPPHRDGHDPRHL